MLRVRAEFSGWSGGPGLSTFYFVTPLDDQAAAERVAERVRAAFGVEWKKAWPNTVGAGIHTEVDVIAPETGITINTLSIPAPVGWTGTGGAAFAPIPTALLCKLGTSTFIAGRRVQGRIFFCPVADANVEASGAPTAAAAASIAAGGESLRTSGLGTDQWCVWHRPKGGTGGATAPITAVTCAGKFSVLRSRRD